MQQDTGRLQTASLCGPPGYTQPAPAVPKQASRATLAAACTLTLPSLYLPSQLDPLHALLWACERRTPAGAIACAEAKVCVGFVAASAPMLVLAPDARDCLNADLQTSTHSVGPGASSNCFANAVSCFASCDFPKRWHCVSQPFKSSWGLAMSTSAWASRKRPADAANSKAKLLGAMASSGP